MTAEKNLKAKAFAALSALEVDLVSMSKLQSFRQDISGAVHKSPLGFVVPRIGGLPLSLVYFLSPYELLSVQSQSPSAFIDSIVEKNLGLSCTVGIDGANNVQLPVRRSNFSIILSSVIQANVLLFDEGLSIVIHLPELGW